VLSRLAEYPGEGILGVYAISFSQRIEILEKFFSKTRTQLIDFDRSYNAVMCYWLVLPVHLVCEDMQHGPCCSKKSLPYRYMAGKRLLRENKWMSGIVPSHLTSLQLCINNETYKAFVFSYCLFCVLRLKTKLFYYSHNKWGKLYILLFILFL